jgi:hypothetical protein
MTSREIADLTGKQHKHVLRDIRVMLIALHGQEHLDKTIPEQYRNRHSEYVRENAEAIISAICGDSPNRGHVDSRGFSWERDTRGYVSLFRLDKDHTLTLITGYDPVARMRIIKRWQELESGRALPVIADPTLAALVQVVVEVDQVKQQQAIIAQQTAALDRKTELLESRVEHVELQHRGNVPTGYLSKKQAHHLYGEGLSEEVFHLALAKIGVPIKNYIHRGDDGYDTPTFAYLESEIAAAVELFLDDAQQSTATLCQSPMLNGKRFRFVKAGGAA